jgi:hypothetical protein
MLPTWLWRVFLESTHTDIQTYPAPPFLPIPPNHGISYESGSLLPVTGIPVADLSLDCPSDSTPPKSTVCLLPASGISNGYFSNNTYSFTRIDTASNFPVAPFLPGTEHIPPSVESREEREPQDRPHQYQKSRKKGERYGHCTGLGDPLTFVKLALLDSRVMIAVQHMHSRRAFIVITERSTIPDRVFIVALNGVAPTSTEITLRSIIPTSTLI